LRRCKIRATAWPQRVSLASNLYTIGVGRFLLRDLPHVACPNTIPLVFLSLSSAPAVVRGFREELQIEIGISCAENSKLLNGVLKLSVTLTHTAVPKV